MNCRIAIVCLLCIALASHGVAQSKNLLPNGSFEEGMTGWTFHDAAPKSPSMGRGAVVKDHVHDGGAACLYEKTAPEKWYPQLWASPVPIKAGGYYEAGAMVDAQQEFTFRYMLLGRDENVKLAEEMPPTQGWTRVKIRFRAPEGCTGVAIGFLMSGHTGRMWIDDVRIEETAPFDPDTAGVVPTGPPPDRIHRLVELSKRTRIKPFELVRRPDGTYPSERLVFRDTATGATIWKMSWNPGYNRHVYSNMPVWNADGSKLILRSNRDTRHGWWLVEPDGSRWAPLASTFAQWHRTDPGLAYWCNTPQGEIHEVNIRTGEDRVLWKLPMTSFYFAPPSHDGKKLLAVENAYSRTAERSYGWLMKADGTGEPQRFDLGIVVHQTWFLKRDDGSFMFNDESKNEKNAYQDKQWICEPRKNGAIRVLNPKHFSHAGVSPTGQRVAHHRGGIQITEVDTGKTWRCMAGGGGHLSWECDDRWLVATMGNNIVEIWVDERRARRVCAPNTQLGYSTYYTEAHLESSPDGTKIGYASSMMGDSDFYIVVQRLPDPPRNVRLNGASLAWDAPEHCRELDGYYVYQGGKPLNREPVGERRFTVPDPGASYTVTTVERSGLESKHDDGATPSPPADVQAAARSSYAVELTWKAPDDPDVAYYNVYASSEGAPKTVQERRIGSPTEGRFLDWGLQAGVTYQYVVTSVDRQGNEGEPSAPVSVRTPPIERFIKTVDVGKALGKEAAAVEVDAPRDDAYAIWAELKTRKEGAGASVRFGVDGKTAANWKPTWDFVSVGHGGPTLAPLLDTVKVGTEHAQHDPRIQLKAGPHRLSFSDPTGSVELLSMTITNDLGHAPDGITSFLAERPKGK